MKLKKVYPEHKLLLFLTPKKIIVSDETRAKLAAAIKKKINPLSEKKFAKLKTDSIKRVGVAISVTNTQTNEIQKI